MRRLVGVGVVVLVAVGAGLGAAPAHGATAPPTAPYRYFPPTVPPVAPGRVDSPETRALWALVGHQGPVEIQAVLASGQRTQSLIGVDGRILAARVDPGYRAWVYVAPGP
jgi:hypothetical protein